MCRGTADPGVPCHSRRDVRVPASDTTQSEAIETVLQVPILPTGGISTSDRLGVVAASGQVWVTAHTSGSSSRVAASGERAYRRSPSRAGTCLAPINAHPAAASPGLPTRPRRCRDRIAPSLVTLWSHPWVSGRRFKPSTGPHLLFRSSGRYGHRIPATADAIGLSAGWCGSNERMARVDDQT